MSTAGGPKLSGIGRSGDSDLMLCLDALDASSYPGEPTTNKSYSGSSPYSYLGQSYDWNNSGTSTRTDNAKDVPKPKGYDSTNIWVCRKETTAVGSQHFGMGYIGSGISPSTQYSVSMWYRQSRAGVGGPYIRGKTSNANHGALAYKGVTGTSNWPVNKWIRITATATTASNETGMFISNYIGSIVGDTAWAFGPQIEAKAYMTPIALNTTQTAAASARSTSSAWNDLSGQDYNGSFLNDVDTGAALSKDGQVLTSFYSGSNPPFSNYIDFDGGDDYVDFGSDVMFKSGGGWTVESWVKPVAVSSGPYNFIGSLTINYNSWYWSVLSSKLAMWDLSPGNVWKYGNTTLSTGQWYHAVLVSDPDNTSYYIYLNGEDDMSSGWSSYNGSWQSSKSSLAVAYLGRGSAAHSRYWEGQMGKVTFYKVPLTADQVKANFNANRSRFGV
jgi:hypothetical protein